MNTRSWRSIALLCALAASARAYGWDEGRDPLSLFQIPKIAAVAPRLKPASGSLVIQATEIGVGKFHRYDNQVHPYPAGAWVDHISPAGDLSQTPLVFDDADGAVTIQFSSLEELLQAVVSVSKAKGAKVSVLNIHGHGLPGAMWYPRDQAQRDSEECADWMNAATAADDVNYKQYYTTPNKNEILMFRRISQNGGSFACTTGAREWEEVAARVPGLQAVFADDAQVHFQSCIVGMGPVGDRFTKTVARLLLTGAKANVQTSLDFGLGDWSMPEGMGFWNYQDDAQLARDGRLYDADHQDREVMQKGSIRVASRANGSWTTVVVSGQDFMTAGRAPLGTSGAVAGSGAGASSRGGTTIGLDVQSYGPGRSKTGASRAERDVFEGTAAPEPLENVRIPGTNVLLKAR